MTKAEQDFETARAALKKAESAWAAAESNLIEARRELRVAERTYLAEFFPTKEALHNYFGVS